MDLNNQNELIQFIECWNSTEPNIYKTNIKRLCDIQGMKPRHIVESLNITRNKAVSLCNPSHSGRIEFIDGLKMAELLKVSILNFLEIN